MPLLGHLQKHIVDPRHANLFIGILNRVLDAYGPAVSYSLQGSPSMKMMIC